MNEYMNKYIYERKNEIKERKKEGKHQPSLKKHMYAYVYNTTIHNSQSTVIWATLWLLHAPDNVHPTYYITVTVHQLSKMLQNH